MHTALGKDLNLIGTLDSVEEAEQIKDEKLRMIAAVAPSKKAREIAKKALYHRQHPEQQAGSSLLHAIEEDTVTSMADALSAPSTSQSTLFYTFWHFNFLFSVDQAEKNEETDTTDIPTIRLRKRGDETRIDEEIQPEDDEERQEENEQPEAGSKKRESWSNLFKLICSNFILGKTILSVFRFIWKIILSLLDWIAAFLNRRSREHRYVAYVLHKEKQHLKEMMDNVC